MKITTTAPLSIAILLSMACLANAQVSRPAPSGTQPGPMGPAPAAGQPPAAPAAPAQPNTAPAPEPRTTTHSASTAPDYKLVPGDKLRIEVYRDAQLSQSLQVRPDGKITMPLIGDVT